MHEQMISTSNLRNFFSIASVTAQLRLQGEADCVALEAKKIDLIPVPFEAHGFDLAR